VGSYIRIALSAVAELLVDIKQIEHDCWPSDGLLINYVVIHHTRILSTLLANFI